MKKIMMILLVLIFGAALEAKNINIIMHDGTIKQAEFLGQDGKSLFVKNAEGKAETIALKSVSKVFDSDSGEEMKIGGAKQETPKTPVMSEESKSSVKQHVEQAKNHAAALKEDAEPAAAPEVKIKGDKYEVLEKGNIEKAVNLFARSIPSYVIFDWDEFYIDVMTGGDAVRSAYGVADHVNMTVGTGFALYLRPFDFAAIGLYTNTEFFFTPGETDSYFDLPSSAYGAAYRWIIYSEEGEAEGVFGARADNMFYFEPRIGLRRLGSVFDDAMLGVSKVEASAVEYSLMMGFITGEFFNVKLGYHTCLMKDVNTTMGLIDIDMSGFYFAVGVAFH